MIQGSDEWVKARLGRVTGSRFGDVMSRGRSREGFGETARSYMLDILSERLTGEPSDNLSLPSLEWGNEYEPAARRVYQLSVADEVRETGFIVHPEYAEVGSSPDALVGDDGVLEIKCPAKTRVHLGYLVKGVVPPEYMWQVHGNIWVTGRLWCDFVSYDPRLPIASRMLVVRVERDPDRMDELEERMDLFLQQLNRWHAKFTGKETE